MLTKKEEAQVEKVRGDILNKYIIYRGLNWDRVKLYPSQVKCIYDFIDSILSHPKIRIEDDDQGLPNKVSDEIADLYNPWALRPNYVNEQVMERLANTNIIKVIKLGGRR